MKQVSKKKIIIAVSLVVSLLAIISMSTLAWFTDEDSVTNEFLVADSNTQDDDIFSVNIYEQQDKDGDGVIDEQNGDIDNEETGISYEGILPGDEISKIAHVVNDGTYYDEYVRVIIDVSDAAVWKEMLNDDIDNIIDCFGGYDATEWDHVTIEEDTTNDIIRIVMYHTDALAPADDVIIFETVNIPTALTVAQAVAMVDGFTVKVKAQAVQTANVGDSAYEAFQTVGLAID